MRPATRSHISKDQDAVSRACGIACDPADTRTRQEFKATSDVANILKRHGANLNPAPMPFGAVDFDLDLQTAYETVAKVTRGYHLLPEAVRAAYPDIRSILTALANGEVIDFNPAAEGSPAKQGNPQAAAPPPKETA